MKTLKLSKAKSTLRGIVAALGAAVAAAAAVPAEPGGESAGTPIQAVDGIVHIGDHYQPRGKIGDIGDIKITQGEQGSHRITYTANGEGPHEWEYKFIDGKENPKPASFAGCCWISPTSDWGRRDGGHDFRKVPPYKITWQARCIGEPFAVEFLMGGNNWVWEGNKMVTPPYPETLSQIRLGVKDLTEEWQDFEKTVRFGPGDDRLRRAVSFFVVVISPGDLDGRTYELEVRNIDSHVEDDVEDDDDDGFWKFFVDLMKGLWRGVTDPRVVAAVVTGVFGVLILYLGQRRWRKKREHSRRGASARTRNQREED